MFRFAAWPAVLAIGACGVYAQSLVETSIAAAGGTAAGVAGKKVSDGLDVIFKKLDATTEEPTKPQPGKKKGRTLPLQPGIPSASAPAAGPRSAMPRYAAPAPARASARPPVYKTGFASAVRPKEVGAPPPIAYAPAPAAPREPQRTVADLQSLASGATREDVMGRMGKPAARIIMADDRGLVEVYTYRNQEGRLGTVRMVNGAVAEVRSAQ